MTVAKKTRYRKHIKKNWRLVVRFVLLVLITYLMIHFKGDDGEQSVLMSLTGVLQNAVFL